VDLREGRRAQVLRRRTSRWRAEKPASRGSPTRGEGAGRRSCWAGGGGSHRRSGTGTTRASGVPRAEEPSALAPRRPTSPTLRSLHPLCRGRRRGWGSIRSRSEERSRVVTPPLRAGEEGKRTARVAAGIVELRHIMGNDAIWTIESKTDG
jgi:hypothetical protein